MIANEWNTEYEEYLKTLWGGGLICPSLSLHDFVFQDLELLDFILPLIHDITKNKSFGGVLKKF